MITSAITVLRPTAPGVAPGTALPAGPAGASAYQLWLAAGNTGSASDFLASLVGPPASASALTAAAEAAVAAQYASLPTTLPATSGVLWSNGGMPSIS